jgi:hypothetical protein
MFTFANNNNISDEQYQAIGRMITQWSLVEGAITVLVSELMHSDPGATMVATSGMQTRSLLHILRLLLHYRMPQAAKNHDRLLERLERAHQFRNEIAHSSLGAWRSYPGSGPLDAFQRKVRLTKKGLTYSRNFILTAHKINRMAAYAQWLGQEMLRIESGYAKSRKIASAGKPA